MRKSALLAGALGLAVVGVVRADEFGPGPGGPFPDALLNNTPGSQGVFTSTIVVPAGLPVISFNSATLNMGTGLGPAGAHTWAGDLSVTLTAPNGDSVHLFSRPGVTTATGFGNDANFASAGVYTFVNSGGLTFPVTAPFVTPIPPGSYNRSTNFGPPVVTPQNTNTYSVFTGDPASGVWTLRVEDWAAGDTGGLASIGWTMDITVPEPGSLSLLAGAAILPLMRRRRR